MLTTTDLESFPRSCNRTISKLSPSMRSPTYATVQLILQQKTLQLNKLVLCRRLAAEVYQNQTSIPRSHIVSDPNYGDSSKNMVTLCPTKKTSVPTIMFIIIGTCAGAVLILIIATVLFRQKYMWLEKLNRFRSHHYGDQEMEDDEMIDYWELSPEQVVIKNEQLGHGAYGQVYKGKLIGPSPGILRHHKNEIAQFSDCDCAVKMLPKYASDSARSEFMHEIELMKNLGFHDNIVSMLGCITSVNKSCLVMEYCANRDLLRFLKQRKTELEISKSIDEQIECTKEFLNFGWQIAQGMCYLGQKNIIHRDLAARNILIAGTDGVKNAKISDFGLSLTTDGESPLSASGRLPIKWLAIECLQRELFSVKSDVWSYGIVLFEMYSMGERPFEDIEPLNLIPHLEAGNRPKRPLLATDKIAEVMTRCWDKVPAKRPSFEEISYIFTGLLEEIEVLLQSKSYATTRRIAADISHKPKEVALQSREMFGLRKPYTATVSVQIYSHYKRRANPRWVMLVWSTKCEYESYTTADLQKTVRLHTTVCSAVETSTEGYGYLALIKTAETYMATAELSSHHERENDVVVSEAYNQCAIAQIGTTTTAGAEVEVEDALLQDVLSNADCHLAKPNTVLDVSRILIFSNTGTELSKKFAASPQWMKSPRTLRTEQLITSQGKEVGGGTCKMKGRATLVLRLMCPRVWRPLEEKSVVPRLRKRAITYTTPMSSLDSSDEFPHLADNELSKDENTKLTILCEGIMSADIAF
ncbi:unnamed protein product [Haemonchus placei]|uniref:receptor protein-tyrosine kinase n=1 Tax=Haemonchus placei TaxID=6290 RepID=A0A158QRK5_HAEPC|nr:unnamed protein product [Haemonchus placei]